MKMGSSKSVVIFDDVASSSMSGGSVYFYRLKVNYNELTHQKPYRLYLEKCCAIKESKKCIPIRLDKINMEYHVNGLDVDSLKNFNISSMNEKYGLLHMRFHEMDYYLQVCLTSGKVINWCSVSEGWNAIYDACMASSTSTLMLGGSLRRHISGKGQAGEVQDGFRRGGWLNRFGSTLSLRRRPSTVNWLWICRPWKGDMKRFNWSSTRRGSSFLCKQSLSETVRLFHCNAPWDIRTSNNLVVVQDVRPHTLLIYARDDMTASSNELQILEKLDVFVMTFEFNVQGKLIALQPLFQKAPQLFVYDSNHGLQLRCYENEHSRGKKQQLFTFIRKYGNHVVLSDDSHFDCQFISESQLLDKFKKLKRIDKSDESLNEASVCETLKAEVYIAAPDNEEQVLVNEHDVNADYHVLLFWLVCENGYDQMEITYNQWAEKITRSLLKPNDSVILLEVSCETNRFCIRFAVRPAHEDYVATRKAVLYAFADMEEFLKVDDKSYRILQTLQEVHSMAADCHDVEDYVAQLFAQQLWPRYLPTSDSV